jgi:hypothetical protein
MQTVPCVTCGKLHPIRETELIYGLPDEIFDLGDGPRAERAKTSLDICMLDNSRMFIRGLLPLPVLGTERPYNIGVWVELSTDTFREIYALWSDPDQASHAPFPGALANEVYGCPGSRGLPLEIRLTGPTTRPEFYLIGDGHDLIRQQRAGITQHQAYEYSERRLSQNVV